MKTAQIIEQLHSLQPVKKEDGRKRNGRHPNSRRNLAPYKPGESGNPSGKPGYDVAAYICRRALELNQEAIYRGIARRLVKGEPYALQVAADRGYGKLKQGIVHTGDEDGGPIQTAVKVSFVNGDGTTS